MAARGCVVTKPQWQIIVEERAAAQARRVAMIEELLGPGGFDAVVAEIADKAGAGDPRARRIMARLNRINGRKL
ncbi:MULTISPECIES: hypothetical protein [Bradyrhizobium]|uniref:Uncharacterized protein n=1 Tax=Bradyrhizobium septentrionale TaxID=1404411 RepID=A0ABZ2PAC9_9BRAD